MLPTFKTRSVPHEDKRLHAAIAELENAVIALFWEGNNPRLGTLTTTLPDGTSSSLLGDRNQQLGLILGAQIAAHTGKLIVVSTYFPLLTGEVAVKKLIILVKSILEGKCA